ncbi:MAG TPA: FtsX-like permease family protein [Phenylobacterium sp.]|uniref:ABC transporter permease n=1 Tax=Phenylobacterium sp. TaxID=1871053 RepID=UPI002C99847A|nr:FtsX-like permease family protein [Phenylobacterium sp.]HSV03080.1 FtsX-like permease family protein [Phenylobacterium sp.]
MKFLPLIWAGLWRRPGRTMLTLVSIASAFVIFGVLQGFTSGLDRLVANAQADVLVTASRVGPLDLMPLADLAVLKRTPGVRAVARIVFFGGPFRQPGAFLPAQAIDPDEARALDDQLRIAPAQWQALKATRSGALVPADAAKLYGFKVGDRIPLTPQFYANKNGGKAFPVDVVGIYPSNPDDNVFGGVVLLNYDYIDQSRVSGPGTVNDYLVRIDDPLKSGTLALAIDRQFANSPHETKTYSLRQLALASVARLGDVGLAVRLIAGAVFFALLFSVGSVMIQAGRERIVELAVLKTLGFGDAALAALTIAEAVLLCLAAAIAGLLISTALYPVVMKTIHFNVKAGPALPAGLIVAVLLALVTATIPAWRAARLSIVDALAGR